MPTNQEIVAMFKPDIFNFAQNFYDIAHRREVQIAFDDKSAFQDATSNPNQPTFDL